MSRAMTDVAPLPGPTHAHDRLQRRSIGFAQALLTILIAVHDGMTASRRYEDLRRQGMPPDQAASRALAETDQSA